MQHIDWSREKNEKLIVERGVSFEMVVARLDTDKLLDRVKHPNQKKYPHQHMFIVEIDDYVYAVPFVEDDEKIFLKTIIPSNKLTRHYLSKYHEK
jgi:hypothetical protein